MTEQDAPAPPEDPMPEGPIVAWQAPESPPALPPGTYRPQLSIGSVVTETFARYAADPLRIFGLAVVPGIASAASSLVAGQQPSTDLSAVGTYLATSLLFTAVLVVVSLVSTSIMLNLLEGGPGGDLGVAVRAGLARVGWLFVASLGFGLALGAAALVVVLIVSAVASGALVVAVLLGVAGIFVVIWIATRLSLAVVAVVVDRLGAGQAFRLAWQVTRPNAVWLRVLGSVFVIGLLVGPAAVTASGLVAMNLVPGAIATGISALLGAFLTPISSIVQYTLYRRLVGPPTPSPSSLQPVIAPPPFDRRARLLVGATIVLAIAGLVAAPFAFGALMARQLNFPGRPFVGNVPAGTVVFGPTGNLQTCTVNSQTTTAAPFAPIVFMGHFQRAATPLDVVRLRVSVDGTEIVNEVENRGTFECLGISTPETDIGAGLYDFQMFLNDQLTAEGELTVH